MISTKPSLLIVADTYFPKCDGVLIFIKEFIDRTQPDFQLSLLVPHFSSRQVPANTIFLDLSPRLKAFTYNSISFSWSNLRKIKEAVRKTDLVFVQELGPVGFIAFYYARRYKKQTVLYVHNTPWDFIDKYMSLHPFWSSFVRRFFVRLYNKSNLLLIPFAELRTELEKAGVRAEMRVARLGVDITRFTPSPHKTAQKQKLGLPPQPIIGYVGRISNEKNTLILLEAFKKLTVPGVVLLMVGDGRPELVEQFKKTRNCMVTGFVDNVNEYLKAMDIFIMPSLTETTSLATLEAMATGLPVIATKVGYLQRYIIKNHNGIFFPRNSSTLLAIKIETLLTNAALREKLGHNARKTIAYSFSWERSINKIKRLLLANTGPEA